MTPREKLHALPKAALVDLALKLAAERNVARTDAAAADADARRWKRRATSQVGAVIDSEQVRAEAQTLLDEIGPDPEADDHLAELAYAIGPRATPANRPRKTGPRCRKGSNCGKPLNEHGLCSRHDAKALRAMRTAA